MIVVKLSKPGKIVSHTTVWKALRGQGFRRVKPTKKLGLTPRMKQDRLAFALKYKDWTLED